MTSTSETSGETLKSFKFIVEIPQISELEDHERSTEAVTSNIDKMSTYSFWEEWDEWRNLCNESDKLPDTIDYGAELGEGDYIIGAVTSKGTLIAAEFDEIDEDTEVSVLYVRRRNGQIDIIMDDTVYMNAYPVGYKTLNKKE